MCITGSFFLVALFGFTFVAHAQNETQGKKEDPHRVLSGVVTRVAGGSFTLKVTTSDEPEFFTINTSDAKIVKRVVVGVENKGATKASKAAKTKVVKTEASQKEARKKEEQARKAALSVGDMVTVVGDMTSDTGMQAIRVTQNGQAKRK